MNEYTHLLVDQEFDNKIVYTTTKITMTDLISGDKWFGTGFFYVKHFNESELNKFKDKIPQLNQKEQISLLFVITNAHVLDLPVYGIGYPSTIEIELEFNLTKEDGEIDLGKKLKKKTMIHESICFRHISADLACIIINTHILNQQDSNSIHYIPLDENSLINETDYSRISIGSRVLFVGYPENQYDTLNNLPLVRSGYIASIPSVDYNGRGEFIIDAQVFHGSSGSPVFLSWNNQQAFLGVISQTVCRESSLKIIDSSLYKKPRLAIQEIIGLGIVIKARHVYELIDKTIDMMYHSIDKT